MQLGAGVSASLLLGKPANAKTDLRGKIAQGGLVIGQAPQGSTVHLDGRKLTLSPDGHYAFGFAYDQKGSVTLKIEAPGADSDEVKLSPEAREYKVQKINGLPDKYVEPPASVLERIKRDNALIGQARSRNTQEGWFANDFIWPVKGPVTGVFGSQRILNGVPKRPHFGLDIAVGEGVPIKAPVGAIVSMAESDLYFTGGTVILDHGCGISTSYLHMSRIDVKVGDRVEKGAVIGAVGKTGRATGPHLCWRLNWFEERLDPAFVLPSA